MTVDLFFSLAIVLTDVQNLSGSVFVASFASFMEGNNTKQGQTENYKTVNVSRVLTQSHISCVPFNLGNNPPRWVLLLLYK